MLEGNPISSDAATIPLLLMELPLLKTLDGGAVAQEGVGPAAAGGEGLREDVTGWHLECSCECDETNTRLPTAVFLSSFRHVEGALRGCMPRRHQRQRERADSNVTCSHRPACFGCAKKCMQAKQVRPQAHGPVNSPHCPRSGGGSQDAPAADAAWRRRARSVRIGGRGLLRLPGLKGFDRLQAADFSCNRLLGVEGLQGCTSLTELDLSNNCLLQVCLTGCRCAWRARGFLLHTELVRGSVFGLAMRPPMGAAGADGGGPCELAGSQPT